MTTNTPRMKLPVPEDSDFVRLGADAIRQLATSVENMVQGGYTSANWSGNAVTVTFPTAYSFRPAVVVMNANYHATPAPLYLAAVTTTSFTFEREPGVAGSAVQFSWIAVGPV